MHRPFEIEFAPVIRHRAVVQSDKDIAERLISTGDGLISNPEAALVELDAFLWHAAKQHRAEPAIADGQRPGFPVRGRLVIPQFGFGGGCVKTHNQQ